MPLKKKPVQQKIPRKKVKVDAYVRDFPERLPPRNTLGQFTKRPRKPRAR